MVKYKHGRKLVGDRTVKSRLNEIKVTESQFADDTALYSMSRDAFESIYHPEAHRSSHSLGFDSERSQDQGNVHRQPSCS